MDVEPDRLTQPGEVGAEIANDSANGLFKRPVGRREPQVIRRLPQPLADRIAAGEVVERPASVIKELIENALDAGARRIEVSLTDAGRTSLIVQDDGCGMSNDDLVLAPLRHATSKLPNDRLDRIEWMGFRGEALASIASVSNLSIITRQRGQEHGSRVDMTDGIAGSVIPAASNVGTRVEVGDLFQRVPVRLKFLKSDSYERTRIREDLNRLALVAHGVGFRLIDDGKIRVDIPPDATPESRMERVLGGDFYTNSVSLALEREDFRVFGRAGLATFGNRQAGKQFFFVNGRPVRDRTLLGALRGAYEGLLPSGVWPVVVIHLELPMDAVDVNVHPTKAEVRFQDARMVRSRLIAAVREALERAGHRTSAHLSREALGAMQRGGSGSYVGGRTGGSHHHTGGKRGLGSYGKLFPQLAPGGTPFDNSASDEDARISGDPGYDVGHSPANSYTLKEFENSRRFPVSEPMPRALSDDSADSFDAQGYPLGLARCQLYQTYIVAETEDHLVFVDQHAAHERLVYEQIRRDRKEAANDQGLPCQTLLRPEVVALGPKAGLLLEQASELERLGLRIEGFGEDTVIIRGVPPSLKDIDYEQLLQDLAQQIVDEGASTLLEERFHKIFGDAACRRSIRAGKTLSIDEMNALLRQMEATPHSGQCNHGRPVWVSLAKIDIERLFDRR